MEKPNQIKELLKNSILDFKNDIEKLIKNNELKIKLNDTFEKLDQTKILLFIFLINKENMKTQISEFIEKFEIENTTENFNQIEKWYDYFLEVKSVFI